MTKINECKCTFGEHPSHSPCRHGGITGENHDDWICNWCDHIEGNPSQATIKLHKKFTDELKALGRRT